MSCQHLRMNDLDKASKQKKENGDNDERKKYVLVITLELLKY